MIDSSGLPGDDEAIDALPEVERVHSLLATWLGTPASPQILDGFAAAHHDDFSMVTAAGAVLRKTELLASLHRARHSRPGLVIEVSDIEIICATAETTVVRFVEQHHDGRDTDYRRTTAVLRADPEQNRYRWLTVHETTVTAAEVERSLG